MNLWPSKQENTPPPSKNQWCRTTAGKLETRAISRPKAAAFLKTKMAATLFVFLFTSSERGEQIISVLLQSVRREDDNGETGGWSQFIAYTLVVNTSSQKYITQKVIGLWC